MTDHRFFSLFILAANVLSDAYQASYNVDLQKKKKKLTFRGRSCLGRKWKLCSYLRVEISLKGLIIFLNCIDVAKEKKLDALPFGYYVQHQHDSLEENFLPAMGKEFEPSFYEFLQSVYRTNTKFVKARS